MANIVERKRADGTKSYMAQIRIKRDGKIAHRENKTFDSRRAATAWAAVRETELLAPGGMVKREDPTLADVIDKYTTESIKEIGRTKAQVLIALKKYDIAEMRCSEIKSADIVALASSIAKTVQPQTVGNYLSHLGAIFAVARPAWGYPLDKEAMADAFVVCKRLGITSKSKTRDRRPTLAELDRLLRHFQGIRSRRSDSVPMCDIVLFALFSTRRQEEITRIRWADYQKKHGRILVRDMKHPGQKIGNDTWVDLPPEAMAIIDRMPKRADEIFPYSTDAISASFTRACQFLEIWDLRFHDLRHEGVSRLFEMGWNIPHAAAVSGHRSWSSLKRYTHIRDEGDKYAGWSHNPLAKKTPGANVGG